MTSARTVLIVDDEADVRVIVRAALEHEGFTVVEAIDARSGLELARSTEAQLDLVILDLGLPDVSGFEVLKLMRRHLTVPIIILSGHGDETDRILGLELGADDYIPKPFSSREVAARVKAVCRRVVVAVPDTEVLEFDGLIIDRGARRVMLNGAVVDLSAREFDLLQFLASSPGRAWSAEDLLLQVWDSTSAWQSPTTVREHVYRLRRKIESDPGNPRHIVTVRGGGYRFDSGS